MLTIAADPLASAQRMVEACAPKPLLACAQPSLPTPAALAVDEAESRMLALPQAECPVVHHFGPGVYIREVHLPAGIIAIGHRQRLPHMNVMLKGRVLMLNDDGTTKEVAAPLIFVGQPGRKIGYVMEDVVWQNIYATDETDVETLEQTYLDKSAVWQDRDAARRATLFAEHDADREDYVAMLKETGFAQQVARAQAENEDDQIRMPRGSYTVMVSDSPIEGKGLFATADILTGSVIAPARIGGMRTPAGRYTNHSVRPNAVMKMRADGDIDLIATRQITGCRGGYPGEEITIDYRESLRQAAGQLVKGSY